MLDLAHSLPPAGFYFDPELGSERLVIASCAPLVWEEQHRSLASTFVILWRKTQKACAIDSTCRVSRPIIAWHEHCLNLCAHNLSSFRLPVL
mmetsp:Transcript_38112/g.87203  ORF Transcript_38112/g.87203 Transcript_38112/m.87203 type:complete len:92 (+) Transcript_38112:545-820(+)